MSIRNEPRHFGIPSAVYTPPSAFGDKTICDPAVCKALKRAKRAEVYRIAYSITLIAIAAFVIYAAWQVAR